MVHSFKHNYQGIVFSSINYYMNETRIQSTIKGVQMKAHVIQRKRAFCRFWKDGHSYNA